MKDEDEIFSMETGGIPTGPGCYLWIDNNPGKKEILYIGKAKNLRSRVRQYLHSEDYKTSFLMTHANDLEWIRTESELEALLLESNLIKKHNPRFNIRLKDDKRYPYLCLTTGEEFPRLIITRKKFNILHSYYGPFSDVRAARNTLKLIHDIFLIRKRPLKLPLKNPVKPCLNYHIGKCAAPCAHLIDQTKYGEIVLEVKNFLDNKNEELITDLEEKMKQYSANLEYEKAAKYRNILADVKNVLSNRQSVHDEISDQHFDIIGIYTVSRKDLEREFNDDTGKEQVFFGQIALLRIRKGNLISKQSYPMTNASAFDGPEKSIHEIFLKSFFREYYLQLQDIPDIIYIDKEFSEKELWLKILENKCGRKIVIHTSAKSERIQSLLHMAITNASLTLKEDLLRENIRNRKIGLRHLQNILHLKNPPEIIECYDISNILGKEAVASGIQLKNGIINKTGYRKYRIRLKDTPDDPAMMHEAISRRMKKIKENPSIQPDLIVIDGGITQLKAALRARDEHALDITIISLAKKEEEIYTEQGEILNVDKQSPGMLLLRLARDEAHRFAVQYHRNLRMKRNLKSDLENIPGVGKQTLKKIQIALLKIDLHDFSKDSLLVYLLNQHVAAENILKQVTEMLFADTQKSSD